MWGRGGGGAEKVLAMLKVGGWVGGTISFGVVLAWELEVVAILKGGHLLLMSLIVYVFKQVF